MSGRARSSRARRASSSKKKAAGGKKRSSKSCKLPKKVMAKLNRAVKGRLDGQRIYRVRNTGQVAAGTNACEYGAAATNKPAGYEAAITGLEYYDPSTGSLVTQSGTTGSFSKKFHFKRIYGKMMCRNNSTIACHCTIYSLICKADTNIAPETAMDNGLADLGISGHQSPLVYPTDSLEFGKLWRIEKSITRELAPGQSMTLAHSAPEIEYDPSFYDSHGLDFHRGLHTQVFFIRVEGPLGHGPTTTTDVGVLKGMIDFQHDVTFDVRYDAGGKIKRIGLVDNSNDPTSTGFCGSSPVNAVQSYAVN